MPIVKRKQRLTRKPNRIIGIDWSNPIARELKAFPITLGDGTVYDLVQKKAYTINQGVSRVTDKTGKSIQIGNTVGDGLNIPVSVDISKGITLTAFFNLDSDTGNGQGLTELASNTTASNNWVRLTAQTNVTGDPIRTQVSISGSEQVAIDLGTVAPNVDNFAATTLDGSTGMTTYLNNSSSSATGTDYSALAVAALYIGSWYQDSTDVYLQPTNGRIISAPFWNRELTPNEIRSIKANPNQLLLKTQYLPIAATVASGFQAAWAKNTNTLIGAL